MPMKEDKFRNPDKEEEKSFAIEGGRIKRAPTNKIPIIFAPKEMARARRM